MSCLGWDCSVSKLNPRTHEGFVVFLNAALVNIALARLGAAVFLNTTLAHVMAVVS